ncbi:MAG: hypothetical protein AMXMBFR13_26860 [Phycisphaerae bacterium]
MFYNPDWEDMSDYVVHFTKATETDGKSEYDNMMSIYGSQVLAPGRSFGIGRKHAPDPNSQFAVCFSEIPLHHLKRLAERRGPYGIGFTKALARSRGAEPIWYLEKGNPTVEAVRALMNRALCSPDPTGDPIWLLTPFIDSPGEYPTGVYRFEWEREWRYSGRFEFDEKDVAFLIIPEDLHSAARSFFESAEYQNLGPAYLCPYIDPQWDRERVLAALTTIS